MRPWPASVLLSLALSALAGRLQACELALLLAVDVSGSVDPREYGVQMQGLAEGLRDPVVHEALVRGRARVALMQWTGTSRQVVSVPWTEIGSDADIERLSDAVAAAPRAWYQYSTAVGEALAVAAGLFDAVAECRRRVIDVSGDGPSNEGVAPEDVRARLARAGITVNALVIEENRIGLDDYFRQNVIVGETSFVVVANDFDEYPERMRQKLRRETEYQLSVRRQDPTGAGDL